MTAVRSVGGGYNHSEPAPCIQKLTYKSHHIAQNNGMVQFTQNILHFDEKSINGQEDKIVIYLKLEIYEH